MPVSQAQQDYINFMEEYTEFLEHMIMDEKEKLAALSSRNLPRIEHSISVSQANAMKMENNEIKRITLQNKAGFEGLSFRELIEQAAPLEKSWLTQLFTRFEKSVQEIRFHNDKSMQVARDGMMQIDPTMILPGQDDKMPNAYRKMQESESDKNNILETKV